MCLVLVVCQALAACSSEYQDVGAYRIATVTDGFAGFVCQPRTEFYFVNRAIPTSKALYLGTCGTPRFVSGDLHMPRDPSCFAVSEDGSSLVYFHLPDWCGAGEKAKQKPGGVYLHSVNEGDRYLYRNQIQVGQMWSNRAIGRHSIRVSWIGAMPSRGGAVCSQSLVISADGSEKPEDNPSSPNLRCKG